MRGSNDHTAVDRVKLIAAATGTGFGGRHLLFERDYFGNHESISLRDAVRRRGVGEDRHRGFAQKCMAEYNLDDWTVPDLIDSGDVSVVRRGRAAS